MALLDIQNIDLIKRQIQPELLEAATFVNSEEFQKMGINVIADLENEDDVIVFERRKGIARKYVPGGMKKHTSIGQAYNNPLKIQVSCGFAQDSLMNYKVKEGFSVLGVNGEYDPKGVDAVEQALRIQAEEYGLQVARNLFHGVYSDSNSDLTIFDGYLKQITAQQTAGRISTTKGNLQNIDLSLGSTWTNDDLKAMYDKFVKFYNGLNPLLKIKGCKILITPEQYTFLGMAYCAKFQSLNPEITLSPSFVFPHMPKAQFVPCELMGTGDKIIATVDNNLDYGTDINSGDMSQSNIEVWKDNDDRMLVNYQFMLGVGTRIKNVNPQAFCTTTGSLTAPVFDTYEPTTESAAIDWQSKYEALAARVATLEEAGE